MQKRGNIYHLLRHKPAQHAWQLPKTLEHFAQALVRSGRLYINADNMRNFVHFTTVNGTISFSARELEDADKLEVTKQIVANSIPQGLGQVAVNQRLEQLQQELKKGRFVDSDIEIRVARLVVQAAHPAVIAALLHERTQVFVSFSHTVGDLMAVHFWHERGAASGMQAMDDRGAQVYISCSGDPFFEGKENEKYYETDGFDALARFMVIGGQELGHFADIRRGQGGGYGRHSAEMSGRMRPSQLCKAARDHDMNQVQMLTSQLKTAGGEKLFETEAAVAFFDKQRQFSLAWCWAQIKRLMRYLAFKTNMPKGLPNYVTTQPKLRCAHFYQLMLADMAFNLAPDADVYKRADPVEEEAIACIEALARVPQQVNKFGHAATQICWPKLYALYYGQVIPELRASLPEAYQRQLADIKPQSLIFTWLGAIRQYLKIK